MSAETFRLAEGGRIDRTRPLSFTFDGRRLAGLAGDTMASALLANGVRLVGRSFKYHRPRGIVAAGVEEPSALVTLRAQGRREPNIPAPVVELFDGLAAESQHRWPSLTFDVMALNGHLSPLFPAGFYYKTFMWPAAFWEPLYERVIRRSAGLGRAATGPDPDSYERAHAHCDVLVVGAGPAGLAAAHAAARAGARVILADDKPEPGGSLLGERAEIDGAPATAWVERVAEELAATPEVRWMPRATVFGYYDHNVLGALERVADHLAEPPPQVPRQRLWLIRAGQVVLATGAIERPLVFADNDRPGVMLASAVRAYLNRFAVAPGRRAVVFTTNDDAYRSALDLAAAGVTVAAVIDARPDAGPLADAVRAAGIPVRFQRAVVRARGARALRAVEVATLDGEADGALRCDLLCVSGGFSPAVHLHSQSGARPVYDPAIGAFVPGASVQAERSAGAARGLRGLGECLGDGIGAGEAAAAAAGFAPAETLPPPAASEPEAAPPGPLWRAPLGRGKAFLDLQSDVTIADIRLAAREGYVSVEHAKRYTTLGMGTDQGKTSSLGGIAALAEARGDPLPAVGTTTFRPPYTPVAIGAFAGPDRGPRFQPLRRTAMQAWHERAGAVFVEAGLWLRPRYYPRPGEDMDAAVAREVKTVRGAVGLADVSTLGKIDIQGSDAARFLDLLYCNTFSTLKVGRARYGLMLREDGLVFDDGTTSRLADDHFFMTTTTAEAAEVLRHLEFHHQVVWPELDVRFASATAQWAGMALAGPAAREVLARVVEGLDVSAQALPFMGVAQTRIAGVAGRVFRISFSGELSYEINVPWGYGEGVWEALLEAGRDAGIAPYGLEALGTMRIEKGHVAGSEIDGRTTAADLGLGRMMSAKKADYIGRRLARRPALGDPGRLALVGIEPVEAGKRLRAGAHLVAEPGGAESLGHVTAVADSPTLGHWIGLALLAGGRERRGERLHAVYPLRDHAVAVAVVEPAFYDPGGERQRG